MPGGKYTLAVKSPRDAFPEQKREFFIRDYRPPRLKKQLEFTRDSYAPGDEVVADFSAERTEGGAVANQALRITATVDGVETFKSEDTKTSGNGTSQVRFTLPTEVEVGDATLSVVVDDGGTQETIAKTIPINLGKVKVDFYPEGGDLVDGISSRVYFFAYDPLGKPVHIEGKVVDSRGRKIADVETKHEGRGWLEITGRGDETYRLDITKPAGVESKPQLPAVNRVAKVVMQSTGVVAPNDPVNVSIRSGKVGLPLVLAATCRGASVGQVDVVTKPASDQGRSKYRGVGSTTTTLQLPAEVEGVVRLTVYDHSQQPPRPVAERLVYRKTQRQLKLTVAEGARKYSPGEKVKLTLIATDENDQPTPAVMGVTVVDDSVLSLSDEKRASMTTQFWLAGDIDNPEDLEDVEFFVGSDEESEQALDLLLGTQGWRRFVDDAGAESSNQIVKADGPRADLLPGEQKNEGPPLTQEEEIAEMPLVYDNYSKTKRAFSQALATLNQARQIDIQQLGSLIFYGGATVVVGLMLLALLRLSAGARYWLPALAGACCCLIIGWLWMGAQVKSDGSVALSSFTTAGINEAPEVTLWNGAQPSPDDAGLVMDFDEDGARDEEKLLVEDFGDAKFNKRFEAEWKKRAGPQLQQAGQAGADFWLAIVPGEDRAKRPADPVMFRNGRRWAGRELMDLEAEGMGMEDLDLAMGMGNQAGGFGGGGGFGLGRYAYSPDGKAVLPLGYMYRQLEVAAAAKDLDQVAKYTIAIEKSIDQYRFPVRQYAHVHKKPEVGAARQDFTETICWQPLVIADENGKAGIEFDLSDSVTTFKVLIDGHGGGRIGTGEADVISRIPFSLEPKMPLEVTAGDRIDLPLAINNDSDRELPVVVTFDHSDLLELDGETERQHQLAAGERTRDFFSLAVVGEVGEGTVEFDGKAGELSDSIKKSVRIVPPGFPFSDALAGQLDGEQEVTLTLPDTWVPGSLKVSLTAYPSALADIRDGIEGIIREPYGCFEQASSSNYPNIWALRFMQDHDIADPEFTRRAKGFLKNGYAKLVGYECPKKGYEWFGGDPGHEALTAYGLMEFRDMSAVWDVDHTMVERTAAWLMKRRDGKGSFLRNSKALDSFGGAPAEITDAYIVWALTEAEQDGIAAELDHVVRLAKDSEDPYLIALSACAAVNSNRPERHDLLAKLIELQEEDGHLMGTSGSITRSGGVSLKVETTSLAAVAWLNATLKTGDAADGKWAASAQKAVQWLAANRSGGGGFGSTQATVLALKALVLNAELNKHAMSDGSLVIQLDDGEVGRTEFSADQVQPIRLQGIGGSLKPGENKLKLNLTGENKMPFALDIAYRTRKPTSADACAVSLTTKLASEKVKAGETIGLNVQVENTTGKGQPMTTAIVGLPAGLEARQEKLEELKEAGKFDYYEQTGRELVFYWRSLSPDIKDDAKIDFTLDLIAEIPGKYEGPASRVYLYYTAEQKHWNDPLQVEIER